MKAKCIIKNKNQSLYWVLAICIVFSLGMKGCKDKDSALSEVVHQFDPSKPVLVSDFAPESGGAGQRLVIYGDNFGNDPSIIDVYIGGRQATVIGVNGEGLYCLVPEKAYEGDIEIRVGEEGSQVSVRAKENFFYERKMVVSTLAGEKDERGQFDTKDGPFDDCGGFVSPSWLIFDPINPDMLYMGQDGGDVRLLNFTDSVVTTPITRGMGNWNRFRSINFTPDGNFMVISTPQPNINGISTSILSRAEDFKDPQILTSYYGNDGADIHPVNGELYFTSFQKGEVLRFDLPRYIAHRDLGDKDFEELFKVQDVNWDFTIQIHPSGDYAYIIVMNQHYILRSDYNWEREEFMTPYVVCGKPRESGWEDGVGASARLNQPSQGAFVKNPAYSDKNEEYDFYFAEQGNHDIRILTPEGKVTTFAGRGSTNVDDSKHGHIDGDLRREARFDTPWGLVYDEENETFYIGDVGNRCIRKIALEGDEEILN